MESFILIIIALVFISIPISTFRDARKAKEEKEKYENGEMSKEEKEIFERKMKMQEFSSEQMRKSKLISKVMIVSSNSDSRKKFGSSAMRGAAGGFFLGLAGLVGGALSGKNEVTNQTTFLIEYQDGHRETKTVDNESSEFKKLCKYLEM